MIASYRELQIRFKKSPDIFPIKKISYNKEKVQVEDLLHFTLHYFYEGLYATLHDCVDKQADPFYRNAPSTEESVNANQMTGFYMS